MSADTVILTRRTTTWELIAAIETACQGGIHIAGELAREINEKDFPVPAPREYELTPREVETLQWAALDRAAPVDHKQLLT